jgi:threonyl-tRNA synthetase
MPKTSRRRPPIDKDAELSKLRHSASHILAAAVLKLYPKTKLGIGPATSDGFYYDFQFENPISDEALPKIEKEMRRIIAENLSFKKSEKTITEAFAWAKKAKQPFKEILINDLKKDGQKKVSFYALGKPAPLETGRRRQPRVLTEFVDLCAGPHVKSTKEIGAFKLTSLAGAYWRGDERNPQLTRIYGTAFPTPKELESYLLVLEEAKKRDHRILGEKLELFSFHEEGPAFPFWHPKGTILTNTILEYLRTLLRDAGYQEVKTPIILSEKLWHDSGHWDNYKDNMYFTEIDGRRFAIKPMNCPGTILIFKNQMRSYRDLPLRLAEFGLVHRHELSGVIHGLFRARAFTQDDAHIFCAHDEKQIKQEIKAAFHLIQKLYRDFGFKDYRVELSTRPEKSIGSDQMWREAEKVMREILKEEKIAVQIKPGEGAFYGPKFDFHVNDSLGRSWQLGTIQLDFSMPERLGAFYIDRKGNKQTPVMIHRTLLGSLERFIGILIEHYGGAFPLWLSPIQVAVLPVGEKHLKHSRDIAKQLQENGLRVWVDESSETVGKKVRHAEMQKIPYILVIGDKEIKEKKLAVRKLGQEKLAISDLRRFVSALLGRNIHRRD